MALTRFRTDYFTRRHALTALGAMTVAGCGSGSDSSSSSSALSASTSSSSTSSSTSSSSTTSISSTSSSSGSCLISAPSCVIAPAETIGPYPAFTNGIVTLTSVFRRDMTTDPAGTYAQRTGVPLTMDIKLVNTSNNCAPLVGYDVYVWHCDADGYYSYYSNQPGYLGTKSYPNGYFLRAAQTSDACGEVTFTTIFPGWYTGRYAHLHIAVALGATQEAVTQMTWPADIITNVYANSSYYSAHGQNPTTLASDNVFEGNSGQIATTTGSIAAGYHSQWVVGIAV